MQLGISSYSFPWAVGVKDYKPPKPLSAFHLVDYAFENKIAFLQFGDNLPLHLLTEAELVLLKREANAKKVKLQVGTCGLRKQNIIHYLSIAKTIGSPFLRVVIDDEDFRPSQQEIIQTISGLLPYLKQNGICLAIENHDRFTARTLKTIIEETDPMWVNICMDTTNSFGAGESLREVVQHLAPYTLNLHIKDYTIKRLPHKMGFIILGCPAGDGALDIPWLLNEFIQHPKCTVATLETWCSPEDNLEATLQKEKAWIEKSIHYLKNKLS
jgi:sugar phosphate isomerase/epimerase